MSTVSGLRLIRRLIREETFQNSTQMLFDKFKYTLTLYVESNTFRKIFKPDTVRQFL
mgnify:CR=1 FL=1